MRQRHSAFWRKYFLFFVLFLYHFRSADSLKMERWLARRGRWVSRTRRQSCGSKLTSFTSPSCSMTRRRRRSFQDDFFVFSDPFCSQDKDKLTRNNPFSSGSLQALFNQCWRSVTVQIRIRGSVPLTKRSGSGSPTPTHFSAKKEHFLVELFWSIRMRTPTSTYHIVLSD